VSSSEKAAWPLTCRNNSSHCILDSFCAFTWQQPFYNDLSKIFISSGIKPETRSRAAVGKEIGQVKSHLSFGVWFLEIVSPVTSLEKGAGFTKKLRLMLYNKVFIMEEKISLS